jgi:hypothetical protein
VSMTIPEAHAEIRRLYDAAATIENKYPSGLTQDENAEDYAEAKRLLGQIDGLEDALSGLEDAAARKQRILDNQKRLRQPVNGHTQPDQGAAPDAGGDGGTKLFGRQFVESGEYKRIVESSTARRTGSSSASSSTARCFASCSARRLCTPGAASAGRRSVPTGSRGSTTCGARPRCST